MDSRDERINQLREAIAAQEALRSQLGDATIELSLKPLRGLLDSLLAEATPATSDSSRDELLAQLQSYIPRQLAEKIRASGHVQGERRQVTVMFADVSGFTALSETLDPEEVASLMNECLKDLVDAVYQYEGMVDKFIGDCVMAVFGAPIALEDDAERALHAALAMREKVERFNERCGKRLKEPLALHIGINSGTVIAGNVGNDLRMDYTVMGDTVNVASRLEGAATRGQIFVSHSAYRLSAGAFRFRQLEPIQVKGKRELLKVYELLEAKIQPDKIRGLEGLVSPLVGRASEFDAITDALAASKRGDRGSIVLLHGDAGVGKSRLLREVRATGSEGVTWLEGRCFAISQTLSYGPILDLLRRQIGIADEQHIDEQESVLRRHVETYFPTEPETYPVLARLLALPLSDADSALFKSLEGEEFRARVSSIIERHLSALSSQQPLVVLIEDIHWADQSTIDLLIEMLPLTKKTRLSFVCVSRSRKEPTVLWGKLDPTLEHWGDGLVEVSLEPLSTESGQQLIEELLGGNYLPEVLAADILNKTDGNPFFLEEVLRSLIEGGVLAPEGDRWKVTESTTALAVPDTVQGVLLARMDRLAEELKQLLQKASVIGRVFLYRVLKVLSADEGSLEGQLTSLQVSDLLRERARLPEVEYIFKHALTQEVAYQTLLAPARRQLHQKVGDAIEQLFQDRLEEFSGVIAYHYYSAESWEKALQYLIQCSTAAYRVHLFPEVRGHCHRALECLRHLDDTRQRREQKIDVIIQLINASLTSDPPEKNLAHLAEAEEAAKSLQDPLRLALVQLMIGRAHYGAGALREAIDYFQKVLAVAPSLNNPQLTAVPGCVLGVTLAVQGRFKESLHLLDEALPHLEVAKEHHEILLAYSYRGCALTCLGRHADGTADINYALELASSRNNRNAMCMAHCSLAFTRVVAGEYADGVASARQLLEIAERTGAEFFRYGSNALIAWGTFRLGRPEEASAYWAAAHQIASALGTRLFFAEWFGAIEAESVLNCGDPVAGLRKAEEALVLSRGAGSVIGEALSECVIGQALAASTSGCRDAFIHIAKGRELLETIGAKYDLARALLAEAQIHLRCDDHAQAKIAAEQAAAIAHECKLEREESLARSITRNLEKR